MYIVFLVGSDDAMGHRFEKHEAAAMGQFILDNVRKGISARVEKFC